MSDTDLAMLERAVEGARSCVKADLGRLRDPENIASLKQSAVTALRETKSQIVRKVQVTARENALGFLGEVKERAAANPGAVLAIVGGLAWRLVRHPPIASALVGVGVWGLFRTDPKEPATGSDLAARATALAGSAKSEIAWRAGEGAVKLEEVAATTKDLIGRWADDTGRAARRATTQLSQGTTTLAVSSKRLASRAIHDDRDAVLFGAAALAMAAALGIGLQRR